MNIIKKKRLLLIILLFSIAISSGIYLFTNTEVEEISYNTFLSLLNKGIVEEVYLGSGPKIELVLENGSRIMTDNPRTEGFKEELLLKGVKVVEKNNQPADVAMPIILLVSLGVMLYYFRNNASKEAEKEMVNMSKMDSAMKDSDITFRDVAGNEEAKRSLEEMVDFIKNPEVYKQFGARMPRGVLLYGPPGTGKTLLAKALAGEANVDFYPVAGSDFVQVYAGLGASRIRELFKKAKDAGKSVIFIDEIDSIGKKRRGSNISGSEEGDRTLNALLAEMSGFKENEGIIVVAATNRLDVLDEALLRPGRFDRQIEVELPDVNARHRILKLHAENKPISKDVDLKKLAMETVYFSGAKLENLMNEAAILAVKEKASEITKEHINSSYYKVLVGDEKLDRSHINFTDKKITAYHEAGHALVAKLVDNNNRVTRVSIIPSTKGIGGFSLNIPQDKMYRTKNDLKWNIMIALGGRAAEEIIFGKENITSGASFDLEKATETALSMVGNLGMDEDFGLINVNVLHSKEIHAESQLMERTSLILEELYKDTVLLLENSKEYLEKIALELIHKESIDEMELDKILGLSGLAS